MKTQNKEEITNIWLLADELTVKEAALIWVDVDPDSPTGRACTIANNETWPRNFGAALRAIGGALSNKKIDGRVVPVQILGANNEIFGAELDSVDAEKSVLVVQSLIEWAKSKGVTTGYFFQTTAIQEELDTTLFTYTPRLAGVIQAKRAAIAAFTGPEKPKCTPMEFMASWILARAAQYEYLKADMPLGVETIKKLISIANWHFGGPVAHDDD